MRALCEEAGVDYCDLLAQPLEAVAQGLGPAAEMTPRARPPLDETYFRRIAAIEFAVKNDDGLGRGLDDADVVLVGVSRTSKTPLSIYLGYLGWKATNVPLVKGIEPPAAALRGRSGPDRRADDRRAPARRDPQRARRADGRRPQATPT